MLEPATVLGELQEEWIAAIKEKALLFLHVLPLMLRDCCNRIYKEYYQSHVWLAKLAQSRSDKNPGGDVYK